MLTTEFDLATALNISNEEGREKGLKEGKLESVIEMVKIGISTKQAKLAAKKFGISEGQFEHIKKTAKND